MYDLNFMESFIKTHVSDYCGYHHRQFLLLQLIKFYFQQYENGNFLKSISSKVKDLDLTSLMHNVEKITLTEISKTHSQIEIFELWSTEFLFCDKLILVYPGYESIWNYRKFLWFYWILLVNIHQTPHIEKVFEWKNLDFSEEFESIFIEKKNLEGKLKLELTTMEREIAFISFCFFNNESSNYEKQKKLSGQYLVWFLNLVSHRSFLYLLLISILFIDNTFCETK